MPHFMYEGHLCKAALCPVENYDGTSDKGHSNMDNLSTTENSLPIMGHNGWSQYVLSSEISLYCVETTHYSSQLDQFSAQKNNRGYYDLFSFQLDGSGCCVDE